MRSALRAAVLLLLALSPAKASPAEPSPLSPPSADIIAKHPVAYYAGGDQQQPPSASSRGSAPPSFWGSVDLQANLTAQAMHPRYQRDFFPRSEWQHELETLGLPRKSKLLIMPPILFDSHLFIFNTIAAELHRQFGHETTFLLGDRRRPVIKSASSASRADAGGIHVKRYPSLFSSDESQAFLQQRVHNILAGYPMIIELYQILGRYVYNCDLLFTEGRLVLEELRRENFDMVLVDPNELCGFLIAKELGLPHAALSTGMWTPAEAAIPQPVSYVPEFNSLQTDVMGLSGRIINLFAYLFSRVGSHIAIFPLYNALIRKHGITGPSSSELAHKDPAELFTRTGLLTAARRFEEGEEEPAAPASGESSLDDDGVIAGSGHRSRRRKHIVEWLPGMIARTKAWLVCSDFALDFPRPYLPNVEYVGGILGHEAQKLPADLQAWADEATEGFVLVTFGAAVEKLTPRLQRVFVEGLSMLPHPVIWRFPRKSGLDFVAAQVGGNVKLVDWLPQNDLLAHSNCALFIGHGGTNGAYEALYHGVPVIGMPLFGDHYDSSLRTEAKGFGRVISWKTITAEGLVDAAMAVLADAQMKLRAKYFSRVHRDFAGGSALQRAVERLDYTLRYKGADHLRPYVYELGTMQFFLLDVALLSLALALAAALLVRCGLRVAAVLEKIVAGRNCCAVGVELPKWHGDYATPTSAAACSSSSHAAEISMRRAGGGVVGGVLAFVQQRLALVVLRLRAITRQHG